jgi:gliding motility-associated-like protein
MRPLKFIVIILTLFVFVKQAKATHNRAGEITYKWLFGYTYQIKITTYTNIGSTGLADRCEDTLHFGDGSTAVVLRSNGGSGLCSFPAKDGVPLPGGTIKLNEYVTNHTYSGPGNYLIWMEDPNRNAGVINLPNSVNQVFYIESFLVISTFSGANNSPVLSFPPIDKGCVGHCFYHNPGAYDVDGDSLSYELSNCRGSGGIPIVGYTYPSTGVAGVYSINAVSGTLTWCAPQLQGEYNLALIIKEWRKTLDGNRVLVGYVLRDLQVDVGTCNNNNPIIKQPTDTCILAGSILTKIIRATDPDGDFLTLSANGGPFGVSTPIATFASSPGFSPVSGIFNWSTVCAHIRKAPYPVTVKAIDSDPSINLVDFKTFNITVVAPPPLSLTAVPIGSNINLKWKKPTCHQFTGNKIEKYCVYRKADCTPWIHATCETGVPAYTGFVLVGCTSSLNDTTLLDTNYGNGLSQGTNYSYLVIAVFTDNAESYASNQVCTQLKRDVPVLINVDVTSTSTTSGSVFVRWIKPLLNSSTALDTIALPGPYQMKLSYYNGFATSTYTTIYSVTKPYFAAINQLSDTTFTHSGINTSDVAHTYKIDFYANAIFIGSAQRASSVFLTLLPGDNQMKLNWKQQVPWVNYKFRIWRKIPSSTVFVLRDSTTALTYTDLNLVNGATYCYKVEAIGQYSDPSILRPLINFSQEACAKPIDLVPPCSPKLDLISDCQLPSLVLQWNNPNNSCADDVVKYNIYIAETDESPLILKDSIKIVSDTIIAFDNLTSIAGCYAITAVDSFGNESLQSAKICVDNCPEYELPNVITLNSDGVNDFFKPIKNKFIKDIDLKVYNRWGVLVFETTDPKIMWDGNIVKTKQPCVDGTYFYVCQVNEIRVKGIQQRFLKGFLQIFNK